MKYKDIDLHKVEELLKKHWPEAEIPEWTFREGVCRVLICIEVGLDRFINRWITINPEDDEETIAKNAKEAVMQGLRNQIAQNNTVNKALYRYKELLGEKK